MGGIESQGISSAGQTVLAKLMESKIWHLSASSMALWVQKRDNGLCLPFCCEKSVLQAPTLMPDTSGPPCVPLVPYKLPPWCWSSEGMGLSKFMCGFFKGNFLALQKFLPPTLPHWFLQLEVMGTYLPGTKILGCGAWCEAGTPHSQDIPLEFLSTTRGCGTSPFHISTTPTSLGGCGFFNSVVVRIPFNSISDGSE